MNFGNGTNQLDFPERLIKLINENKIFKFRKKIKRKI